MVEILFLISVFLLLYTFIGYPLFLWGLSKFVHHTATYDITYEPSVDVILVVRNAEKLIEDKIESLLALNYNKKLLSIIVVSDNSTDATVKKITDLKNNCITCIDNKVKTSKSACVNQAVAMSKADLLFMTDVRQPIDSLALKKLVRHFTQDNVAAVSGELVFKTDSMSEFAQGIDAYWHYEKFIRRTESKIGSVPGVTGAIYVMRRLDFRPIDNTTLLDDVLIPMQAVLCGKRVLFESEAVAYDVPSHDVAAEKIRKTRTLAGNWQILAICPSILNPFKNHIWIQYFSHKVLRLFCPLFLVIIFFSSAYLSSHSIFYQGIFILQVFGYAVLIVASKFPVLLKLKIIKIPYSFFMLMLYTAMGFWSFVSKKHLTIWK